MGKKNPLKEVVKGAVNIVANPIREVARTVGADGIVKGVDSVKKIGTDVGYGAIDLANDEKGKQKRKAEAENAIAAGQAAVVAEADNKKKDEAAYAASEAERMASGSKSRTLLTGPAGLDDEEETKSITRRTLSAR